MGGDAISTGWYPEWNKRVCTSPAADRHCGLAFLDVLGSHPPGMNELFWEIGLRKSLLSQDLDGSRQRSESREFVI